MKKQNHWRQYWLLEAVRLKESQWGPIEDAVEVRRAVAAGGSFDERLLLRAQLLGQRAGWHEMQQRMLWALRLSFFAFSLLFVALGLGVAASALATVDGRVNILVALVALLGIPTLSFLLWMVSLFLGGGNRGNGFGLGHTWLWLSQRLVKGPDQALLFNALFSFGSRQRLLRWSFSAVNHWLWLLALLSATFAVLALLAAKRYSFNWETTLLGADSFVALVQGLGVLPAYFGFLTPAETVIRQSDGIQLLPAAAQVQWSSWLVGCLVIYGILPRLLALAFSVFLFKKHQRHLVVDSNQLGLIELRQRLLPQTESVGIDAEAGADQVAEVKTLEERPSIHVATLVVGVELSAEQAWPPSLKMPTAWQDAGMVDSREQRAELLEKLSAGQFEHLLLCVDATQTPDRGVVAWLAELASYGKYCTVYLMNSSKEELQSLPSTDLLGAWFSRLDKAGFKAVYTDFDQLLTELKL